MRIKMFEKSFDITGPDGAFIYIHRHIKHFNTDRAIQTYKIQKEAAYRDARKRYKTNIISSKERLTSKDKDLLELALSQDVVMRAMSKDSQDIVKGIFMEMKRKTNYGVSGKIAGEAVTNFINTKELKQLDDLFIEAGKVSKIISGNENEITLLLKDAGFFDGGTRNYPALLKMSGEIMSKWDKSGSVVSTQKEIRSMLGSLHRLTAKVINAETEPKLESSLRGFVMNIFYRQLASYLVDQAMDKARAIATKIITENLMGIGNFKKAKNLDDLYRPQTKREKLRFKYVFANLFASEHGFEGSLGISADWYRKQERDATVEIQDSKTMINKFKNVLLTKGDKYNASNSIAFSSGEFGRSGPQSLAALKTVIIARNIDFFINAYGFKGDYSQIIVINGLTFSALDILEVFDKVKINSAVNNVFNISIQDTSPITDLHRKAQSGNASLVSAYTRVRRQQKIMEGLTIKANFLPDKLVASLSSYSRK